jgi:predicted lipid-binding transport protein (Tim44 family)
MGTYSISHLGLPLWLQAAATVLGLVIAGGILNAMVAFPDARRMRRRVAAVEAAAGDDPVFGREPVRAAALSLYREVYEALAAGDRWRLARICDDNALGYWKEKLDGYERDGRRYRATVVKAPRVDYIGVMDRPGGDDDWVCLRVRGSLRQYLEDPDGKLHSLPEYPGQRKIGVDEFWTLRRRDDRWIFSGFDSLKAGTAKGFLTEEFIGPGR